jgi:hypothetical protein
LESIAFERPNGLNPGDQPCEWSINANSFILMSEPPTSPNIKL